MDGIWNVLAVDTRQSSNFTLVKSAHVLKIKLTIVHLSKKRKFEI